MLGAPHRRGQFDACPAGAGFDVRLSLVAAIGRSIYFRSIPFNCLGIFGPTTPQVALRLAYPGVSLLNLTRPDPRHASYFARSSSGIRIMT